MSEVELALEQIWAEVGRKVDNQLWHHGIAASPPSPTASRCELLFRLLGQLIKCHLESRGKMLQEIADFR